MVTKIKSKWSSGSLIFFSNEAVGSFQIGEFVSAAAGSGMVISSSRTAGFRIYADDGAAALTAGSYRAGISRMLVVNAITTGDISIFGFQGQIKVKANVASSGHLAGLWGYAEISGASVSNVAGVKAMIDVPSGATVASGAVASGLMIVSNDLGGTITGDTAMIHVPNPVSGTWEYAFVFGSAPGAIVTDTSNLPAAATHKIKCKFGSTEFYLIGVADF